MEKIYSCEFVSDYASVYLTITADDELGDDALDDIAKAELIDVVNFPDDFYLNSMESIDG